jgi:hypothetical protein
MKKAVLDALAKYPKPVREALLELRELILETARHTAGVGAIEEDLRWGQPSFLTSETGSGSTIRIDGFRNDPTRYAMFFHCQSGLVGKFREIYGDTLHFVGERAIEFQVGRRLPKAKLTHCIGLALTHHLHKRPRSARKRRQGAHAPAD